ncbi:MAG TPA: cupin domain-containing protein [Caulobacteraceae bacterium]
MDVIDTRALPVLEKAPGWRGRMFHSANMTFGHWDFAAGSSIHEHSHDQEEVWQIIDGEVELTVDGVAQVAGPGTAAIVPPGARHSVTALTDGVAIVVDYPLRLDFGA